MDRTEMDRTEKTEWRARPVMHTAASRLEDCCAGGLARFESTMRLSGLLQAQAVMHRYFHVTASDHREQVVGHREHGLPLGHVRAEGRAGGEQGPLLGEDPDVERLDGSGRRAEADE